MSVFTVLAIRWLNCSTKRWEYSSVLRYVYRASSMIGAALEPLMDEAKFDTVFFQPSPNHTNVENPKGENQNPHQHALVL